MLQQEGAREKGIRNVLYRCNTQAVPRYGGWNNESVATDIKFKASKLEEGCCNEKGPGRKALGMFFDCCNTVPRYGGWSNESIVTNIKF